MSKADYRDIGQIVPVIHATEPTSAMPDWAILQRSLFTLMNDSIDILLENYLTPEGEYFWPDIEGFQAYAYSNMDNAFEGFHGWPLFYLLGGSSRFLTLAHRQNEALIRQFSRLKKKDLGIDEAFAASTGRDTLLVDEYLPDIDWMHQGEAAMLFYYLCLADPNYALNKERAIKFASFFMNESENVPERNYDSDHRVFRSSLIGSNGPAYRKFDKPYSYSNWMEPYGLAFYDVPGVQTPLDLKNSHNAERYGKVYCDRLRTADTVTNLFATSMILNAYLHTGEEKYRSWVLNYIDGWRERYAVTAARSGGAMPDNAGPSGIVGETMEGKWYGGHYGWTFPHGFMFIGDALIVAGENERLLTGREGRLDWVREQLDLLLSQSIEDEEGRLLLPQKYADPGTAIEYKMGNVAAQPDQIANIDGYTRLYQKNGWFEFRTPSSSHPAHVYMDTFSEQDFQLLVKFRDKTNDSGERLSDRNVNSKTMGGQYQSYINYLKGGYKDYPVDAMRYSINQVYKQLRKLRMELRGGEIGWGYRPDNEEEYRELQEVTRQINAKYGCKFSESTVHSYFQTFLLYRSTVTTEALVHLTMGGMLPVYNGGLLQVSVRYFDVSMQRPGLPEHVAALVHTIQQSKIAITLCNLHPSEQRRLIVQAGAFGEHQFTNVTFRCGEVAGEREVTNRWFEVILEPGCLIDLHAGLRRNAYQPSYVEPFRFRG